MAAGSYNVIIDAGATWTLSVTYEDPAGVPINLTGYTAKMQIRSTQPATDTTIELSTVNGRIVNGGANGVLTLTIAAADTGALTLVSGVYDLTVTAAGGAVTRLLEGNVTVKGAVTR